MKENKELLDELKENFEEVKNELGFEISYEEMNDAFSIDDFVLSIGFISPNFSRQLCSRIVEHYRDWHHYLNNLLLPNPSYYAGQTESKLFSGEKEKKEIWDLIKLSMKFSSMHSFIGLKKDKVLEKKFIEEGYANWINIFNPKLMQILEKIYLGWDKV